MDKFADLMVKDLKTGTCYRADKYLVEYLQGELNKKKKPPAALAQEFTSVIVRQALYAA